LMTKGKLTLAIGLANNLIPPSGKSPLMAQLDGMQLAYKDGPPAAAKLPKPPETDKIVTDTEARVAYTEGSAYKKEYGEALRFASAKGPPPGRLEACLAGAAIALADTKSKDAAKEALPFVTEGLAAYLE